VVQVWLALGNLPATAVKRRGELTTALDIANQATTIMTADKLREQAPSSLLATLPVTSLPTA